MAPRPCSGCGTPTTATRCTDCERQHQRRRNASPEREKYRGAWPAIARRRIADHRSTFGDVCPGYGVDPHPVGPSDWTCDHDLGPLCRSCNGRKGATEDKQRAAARR